MKECNPYHNSLILPDFESYIMFWPGGYQSEDCYCIFKNTLHKIFKKHNLIVIPFYYSGLELKIK